MLNNAPLTDDQVKRLADGYLQDPKVRGAMEALGQTQEEYTRALRQMHPYPTMTASGGANVRA